MTVSSPRGRKLSPAAIGRSKPIHSFNRPPAYMYGASVPGVQSLPSLNFIYGKNMIATIALWSLTKHQLFFALSED